MRKPWSLFARVILVGWFWVMLASTLLLLGAIKQINLLILLACPLLGLWVIQVVFGGRGISRLSARRSIQRPIFAGSPFTVATTVKNGGRLRRSGVTLEDESVSRSYSCFVERLPAGQSLRLQKKSTLSQRGQYTWGPLLARSGYPFGLTERCTVLVPSEEVIILPQLGRLDRKRFLRFLKGAASASRSVSRSTSRHWAAQTEFHGLRAFRSGDSQKSIHWRTSARRGELMVREFEELSGENLLVLLDPSLPTDDERNKILLDDVISFASTLCWEWPKEEGGRLFFIIGGDDPKLFEADSRRARLSFLERLAHERGSTPTNPTQLANCLLRKKVPKGSFLVLSVGPSTVGATVFRCLNGPATGFTAPDLRNLDFYELPEVLLDSGSGQQ